MKLTKRRLLFNIAFWHVLASVMAIHVGTLRYPYLSLKEVSYWLWILASWSYLTSFLTITWIIYKLSNKKNNYFSQIFDLTVANVNVIDTVFIFGLIVYYLGGGKFQLITTPPRGEKWIEIYWIIYNFIWHVIAPGLVIYYFFKFSQIDLLERERESYKMTLLNSLAFPTSYFFYVIGRPVFDKHYSQTIKVKIANNLNSSGNLFSFSPNKLEELKRIYQNAPQGYQMPKDYPYPFFYRCMGKKINCYDKVSKCPQIIWIIGTFVVWYLIFILLSHLLLQSKKRFFVVKKSYSF